ncbi:dephospho-CoA kinase [Salipiger bermudensis]|uniref:dephospho-CoA kinase n=1 Tax=Salipiger bermudensis TaxID=344736 RepID=UPI001CD2CCCF|nr:dephospho-CoA kinase [Salipiger bermudensis]MCA1285988.1 dephospho-CoA kinase [Salipiger bermudensis]
MGFLLGLTGSIGMGKSTTAGFFAEQGCAVWDADAAVHRLYSEGGAAVAPMQAEFPGAIEDGAISRDRLRAIIAEDPTALPRIEAIVHPLVQKDRADFIAAHPDRIVVLDVPLLFETGGDTAMDAVACVSIPPDLQRERVMARGSMSAEDLERILARQMPNDEKSARADYVIETDTLEHAKAQVQAVMQDIERPRHA